MRASVQCNLSFESLSRATHDTLIHSVYEEKRRQNAIFVYRNELNKRELSRFHGHLARKDIAKRITVIEQHVRNRAIASTNSRFNNASIDREAAPLSPKLPWIPTLDHRIRAIMYLKS